MQITFVAGKTDTLNVDGKEYPADFNTAQSVLKIPGGTLADALKLGTPWPQVIREFIKRQSAQTAAAAAKPVSLEERIAQLEAEKAALLADKAKRQTLGLKVSEKGAVSLYGIGRFPVTLYLGQWLKILGHADQIRAFLVENDALLAKKDQ